MIVDRVFALVGGWQDWYWAMTSEQRTLLWSDTGVIACVVVAAVLVLGVQRSLRLTGVMVLLAAAYTIHAARPGGAAAGDGPLSALGRVVLQQQQQPPPVATVTTTAPAAAVAVATEQTTNSGAWQRMAAWIWTQEK
jgi:hypothetical protein